jgi:hypothetical protein
MVLGDGARRAADGDGGRRRRAAMVLCDRGILPALGDSPEVDVQWVPGQRR